MFTHLPIPIDNRTPDGYRLIVAYAKGDTVVVPIETVENLSDEQHNCDWEGCGSMDHVVRFSISYKYDTEALRAENERLKKELAETVPLSVVEEVLREEFKNAVCGDEAVKIMMEKIKEKEGE